MRTLHFSRPVLAVILTALTFTGGCGEDDPAGRPMAAAMGSPEPKRETRTAPTPQGTRLTVRASPFGRMLFDARRQAIYVFERDRKRRTLCYGECARAWPPVLTHGKPVAGKGVDGRLLGTLKRRGGAQQVTYAGRPLYFYAHERPGQVLCHNVDLNGGLWWVVDPTGRPRS